MTTQEHGSTPTVRRLSAAFAVLSAASLAVLAGMPGMAAAQSAPSPVTVYANYPAPIPPGCPQGPQALLGLSFDNGRGDTASSLGGLDVRHGDTVTMSWTGFHAGCLDGSGTPAITVGLAAYDNPTLGFDPEVDQALQDGWQVCGVDGEPCERTGGRYQLALTLPGTDVCKVQLDAHLGLPLAVVGPNGSFYSQAVRGHGTNRLISAASFGLEPCVPSTTSTTAPPVTAAPSTPETPAPPAEQPPAEQPPAEVPTTTTGAPERDEAPAAPPVTETPTTEAPIAPASPPSTTPSTAAPSTTSTTVETKVLNESVSRQTLPRTGADAFAVLRIATWLATAGVGTLLAATALRHRRQSA
ncbi:MAG: hypothetical protein AB7O92_28450 [Acidimicrobiia bacterium]